ncbi:MAG: metalloregulator ArsR/SmtB family transcription factor [Sideroxydans sp.]|nr:metalloregulator ArsR/SmtB family transcription factor [Sideroxydans sp.]
MKSTQVVTALSALAQPTRLAIFRLLVEAGKEGMPVGSIGEAVGVAPTTLSFHLKTLTHAGLLDARQQGRFIFYSANFKNMFGLIDYLTHDCCGGNMDACTPAGKPAAK